MKNYGLLLFICISYLFSNAQENVVTIENSLKSSTSIIKRTFASVDETTQNLAVYIQDSEFIYGYLLNENYKSLNSFKTEILPSKYKVFLGSSTEKGIHNTYFSNKNKTKFVLHTFDFENKTSKINELDLNLENEKFIQSFTNKNVFYILTININTSKLNIYVFNQESIKKEIIDLSQLEFINFLNRKTSLFRALDINENQSISKIDNTNPNSLKDAFSETKFYLKKDKIIITLDYRFKFTEMISIDLNNFSHSYNIINQNQKDDITLKFKQSNSFLIDSLIFQTSIIKDNYVFTIKNLKTKKLLKTYNFNKESALTLNKQAPALDKKEKRKTRQFLRKVTNHKMGVNIQKNNDDYEVTIGSYELPKTGAPMFTNNFGNFSIGNYGNVIYSPGQPSFNFFSYSQDKSIIENTITSVFNKNLKLKKDKLSKNTFDNINAFLDEKSKHIITETIFKYKDFTLLAAVITNSNSVMIMKFE